MLPSPQFLYLLLLAMRSWERSVDGRADDAESPSSLGDKQIQGSGIKSEDLVATGKREREAALGRSIGVETNDAIRFVSLPTAPASCLLVIC